MTNLINELSMDELEMVSGGGNAKICSFTITHNEAPKARCRSRTVTVAGYPLTAQVGSEEPKVAGMVIAPNQAGLKSRIDDG